ncbi:MULTISPECIES: hypothetical protein [unclassified Shinella]|uniref:hypothetical protein n=1 Tax=unclassified Shinella TaxID=2643062 RepID=UPI00234EA69D|nr:MULTISPECIES: hypothetical protein [unclassified Shinella]MCO5152541.1 hypothetical protein [Shinella sp.]MDC7261834.1 hypothetical protein [Shinella sp. HY16]MDC7268729.1 hypothetical protein [Shinella sp. YZ44]
MAIEQDVLEFIIVPPYERRAAIFASKERMEAYLGNRFPGYSFKAARLGPVGDDEDFCILPVMNFIGDDGHSYMCNEPKPWFLSEILAACGEFDVSGRRSFAA